MKVWAITMVKDEADVIGPLLDHLLAEGVDGIVVADNLSTDGTGELVGDRAHLVLDDDPAYRQSEKMTALAGRAHDLAGTDDLWIVPVDADEVWYDGLGLTLAERLRATDAAAVHAPIWNHWCTPLDDPAEANPFRRLRWRAPEAQEPLGKVAYRWHPDITIGQGNHVAWRDGGRLPAEFVGVAIRHFPYRSAEHFVTKARNGAAAYAALGLSDEQLGDMGAHWRGYGAMSEDDARAWFAEWFCYDDPQGSGLVEDPAPLR